MERFYLNEKYVADTTVYLTETEHHHLSRVMRLREGDEIELVNGFGSCATARITKIDKHQTRIEILSLHQTPQTNTHIMIGIPLMRPSKLEWVLEKGTELGADAFLLYPADHSTQDSLSDHQIERLRNITISALKQSKRLYLPSIEIGVHLENILAKDAHIYFGDVRPKAIPFTDQTNQSILFITGPESGFSENELHLLDTKAKAVTLNPNVLRAETAPLVALSLICVNKQSS